MLTQKYGQIKIWGFSPLGVTRSTYQRACDVNEHTKVQSCMPSFAKIGEVIWVLLI